MKIRHLKVVWTDPKTEHRYCLRIDKTGGALSQNPLDVAPALDPKGLRRLADSRQRLAEQFRADAAKLSPVDAAENPLSDEFPIVAGFRNPHRGPYLADYWGNTRAAANETEAEHLETARLLREADDTGVRRVPYLQDVAQAKGEKLSPNAANKRANAAIKAGFAPGAPGYESRSRHAARHAPGSAEEK